MVTEMSAFNVRWEGSDNLSGDGRNLKLQCALQLGRPGARAPDGKALQSGLQMGRRCNLDCRWEGISQRCENGKVRLRA